MKYCPRCRRTIRLAVKVCPFCGGELELPAMLEGAAITPIPREHSADLDVRANRGVDRPAPSAVGQSLDEAAARHIMELDEEEYGQPKSPEAERKRPSLWSEDQDDFGEDSFASFVSELVSEEGSEPHDTSPKAEPVKVDDVVTPDTGSTATGDESASASKSSPSTGKSTEAKQRKRTTLDPIEALVKLAVEARKAEPRDTDVEAIMRRERRSTLAPDSRDEQLEKQRDVEIGGDAEERRQRVSRMARARVGALDSAAFAPKLRDIAPRAVYAAGWRAGLMKATEALREVLEKDDLSVSDLLDLWDRLYTLAYGYDVGSKDRD